MQFIFGFLLIWILDCRRTYCMVVQGIHKGKLVDATAAYRAVLEEANCRILGERKNISKNKKTPWLKDIGCISKPIRGEGISD